MSTSTIETAPTVERDAGAAFSYLSPATNDDSWSPIASEVFALPEQPPERVQATVESSDLRDILVGTTEPNNCGAMDIDVAGPSDANYGLQRRTMEATNAQRSIWHHVGESGDSAGIAEFKKRMGAPPIKHHEYQFERLPVTRATTLGRSAVKRVIGFSDT